MLSRDPNDRPNFDRILSAFRGTIFPEYFYTFLKDYASSLAELPDNTDVDFLQRSASQPGTRIDRMLDEWESIQIHLGGDEVGTDGPALLLLNLVTSSIRNCLWPTSRLHGLKLFLNLAPYLSDEDKVDRIVPFATELLTDETAIVRAEACRTLVRVVQSITSISLLNAAFIPEYLLPQTRHLAVDTDVFVRATYAKSLTGFADAAVAMLEINQAAKPDRLEGDVSTEVSVTDGTLLTHSLITMPCWPVFSQLWRNWQLRCLSTLLRRSNGPCSHLSPISVFSSVDRNRQKLCSAIS